LGAKVDRPALRPCSASFPMLCRVEKNGRRKDECPISRSSASPKAGPTHAAGATATSARSTNRTKSTPTAAIQQPAKRGRLHVRGLSTSSHVQSFSTADDALTCSPSQILAWWRKCSPHHGATTGVRWSCGPVGQSQDQDLPPTRRKAQGTCARTKNEKICKVFCTRFYAVG